MTKIKHNTGVSLSDQRLKLQVSSAGGLVSIPGQGTKFPHASQCVKNTHTHTHTQHNTNKA